MQRIHYIDFLRQVAIYYMFFFHTVLVLLPPEQIKGTLGCFFDIVPLDAALFLFLAGFSLTLSLGKHTELSAFRFLQKKIKRGLLLILAAAFLFFIEFGIQLPDMLISSGILNTIGILCIAGGLVLVFSGRKIILALLIAVLCLATFLGEYFMIFRVPFNWGYEPWSPTIIFGFIGIFCGLFFKNGNKPAEQKNDRTLALVLGAVGFILVVFFIVNGGILGTLIHGRYVVKRNFSTATTLPYLFGAAGGAAPAASFAATVWNYRLSAFLLSLGTVLLLFAASFFLEPLLKKYIPHKVFLPGAHALSNYFFHLLVLSIIVILAGEEVFSVAVALLVLAALYVGSYLLSFGIQYIKTRKVRA
jgi:peptidoglycan/LPS O-acetylase OafA/YrhL